MVVHAFTSAGTHVICGAQLVDLGLLNVTPRARTFGQRSDSRQQNSAAIPEGSVSRRLCTAEVTYFSG